MDGDSLLSRVFITPFLTKAHGFDCLSVTRKIAFG
jgi:hypothetical protein